MYEFWYDYMKPKYGDNVKLCYMDTDSFVMNIKTKDFYKDITNDVEKRFDTSNYEVNRPLPTGTKKCIIKRIIKFNNYKNCLLKDEMILKSQQRFISKKLYRKH